ASADRLSAQRASTSRWAPFARTRTVAPAGPAAQNRRARPPSGPVRRRNGAPVRYRQLTTGSLALGVVLLIDVLRVWLPGIITIFGQAASTPAEVMGAFALGWFVLAMAVPALVRRVGARRVTVVAAVLLAVARLALTSAPGGRPQLWLATAGLFAGLVWLVGVAGGTDRP